MPKGKGNMLGAWAFLIGVILALLVGVLEYMGSSAITDYKLSLVLVIIGLLIGLLNITTSEIKEFMVAGAVLVIISSLGGVTYLSEIPVVGSVVKALVVLFVPATIVAALKAVFALAKK